MKRPHLVHFSAILNEDFLSIRAGMTMKENPIPHGGVYYNLAQELAQSIEKEIFSPRFPIASIRLLKGKTYQMKIVAMANGLEVYRKIFESDSHGNFNFKIPLNDERKNINALSVFEVSLTPGLELLLGSYIPLVLSRPSKLIICDFDKTLVDTKYSTTKEVYFSLTKPLEYFPTVTRSVAILRSFIKKGFHPFIVSASPHFYEEAIRDWLYQRKIFTAGIFLKDYRQVFSLFEMDLTPKDLKLHGLYKLNHLLDILLMSGIPNDIVLMGDNFEADPVIYLALVSFLLEHQDPRTYWQKLKRLKAFQMNHKQDAQLLSKFYQLNNIRQKNHNQQITAKIYIRRKLQEESIEIPDVLKKFASVIELYDGNAELLNASVKEESQVQRAE